ncbi:MAG TPA: lipopolysaccharide kinase InaA family protein [Phycisphaerae bacterium]|nr:lipopolysaccharide kinase InaA family protein [Phycisphaerae bacterium]
MLGDQMWIDPAYRDALREIGLDSVDAALARVDGDVAAWSRTTDTLRVSGGSGRVGFYLKRYRYPRWSSRLRGVLRGTFFGPHRAAAEARLLLQMSRIGLSAVRPVAYGCRRAAHFVTASFLITEEAPGARNLTALARDVQTGRVNIAPPRRRAMIVALARQVAHMHACRFAHAQVFWRNLLVRFVPCGDPEFFFLDARPRHGQRLLAGGARWWMEELAQLNVSAEPFTTRSERLRFCREYFDYRRLTPSMKRRLREVEAMSLRWRRHETQRIRRQDQFEAWSRALAREAAGQAADAAGAGT